MGILAVLEAVYEDGAIFRTCASVCVVYRIVGTLAVEEAMAIAEMSLFTQAMFVWCIYKLFYVRILDVEEAVYS